MANVAQQPGGGGRGNSNNTSNSTTSWVQKLFNTLADAYTLETTEWTATVEANNLTGNPLVSNQPATTSNGSSTTPRTGNPKNYVYDCLDDPDLIEALWEPTEPVAGEPGQVLIQDTVCSSSASSSQNKNFNFLYNLTPSTNVKKNVVNEDLGVYATRIGPDNPYYVGGSKGNSLAIIINWLNGLTVPNCVGYAHGRIKEIWALALKAGFIKKVGGKYVIPSQNNREIEGYVNTERNWSSPVIPCCDAVKFWDNWPTDPGYSKISADDVKNGAIPQVGAIMCWGEGSSGLVRPGHVAVVEQVCNPGLENEYVITSEAYYGSSSGHINVVYKNKTFNGKPYSFQWGYTFRGFLISPVCRLSAANEINVELIKNPISPGDIAAYQAVTQSILGENTKITSQLNVNDKIIISWFGNEKADGTGKRVGNLDAIGTVVNIDRSKDYPYQINVGDKLAGYYTRNALEPYSVEAAPSTNTRPSSSIPNSALYKVRLLAQINVRKSYSTLSEKVGLLEYGTVVDVYETKISEGYTWNRIGTNRWIADNGSWLEKVDNPESGTKYVTQVELHIRTGPGTNYGITRTLAQGSTITVTEQCNGSDGYIWNKIGYNQWVANDGSWLVKV